MTPPQAANAGGEEAGIVTLDDVQAAAGRISGLVRRTPVLAAAPARQPLPAEAVWLKLESLQVTGSFKARGASNRLRTLDPAAAARGLTTASGGNHGLAIAYAAWTAETRAVIFLPESTPPAKAEQLRTWGAEVRIVGQVWDDANAAALAFAEADGLTYVHPFAEPSVIAGQGTVALEFLEQVPDLDLLLVAIGGGGLISGVATAAKGLNPAVKIVGVEPLGAPTLAESLAAGQLATLPGIDTLAGTLAPRRSAGINLEIVDRLVEEIVLVSDDQMREAAVWLWRECGVAAELSGAAALAALMSGCLPEAEAARVGVVVCGAGTDGMGS
ncbi:threonine ammonia-lyase [Algihabitans albus]|uniref:threonine ammonia-lyase n=1 Tax=Algihabitans albus TaxID=2164067 RepID=UPI000E5C7E98|nr:threonine/serine dehydratase [Algihabitans albus]